MSVSPQTATRDCSPAVARAAAAIRSPTTLKNRTESGRSFPMKVESVSATSLLGCRHRLPRPPAVARTSSTVRRMYGETDPFLCSVSPG
jgi:hypothetical protein